MARAYLSLGSNIEPRKHLAAALRELGERFGELLVSPVYRTEAVGFEGPEFLNLAVGLDTDLDPLALDDWLHALEARHGRRRDGPRFSSRTLDADIVLFTMARETQFRTEAMASRIAQLCVVDALIAALAMADYDRSTTTLRETFDVLSIKRF